jgi:hypothetical protein
MAYDIGPFDEGASLGARRLLALAGLLETVREENYDHRTWRRQAEDGSWTMCALGHAITTLPDVIGLRWRTPESSDVVRWDGSGVTRHALELAAEAFELSADDAAMIFGMGLNTVNFYGPRGGFGLSPRAAAAAIRAFACAKMAAAGCGVAAA